MDRPFTNLRKADAPKEGEKPGRRRVAGARPLSVDQDRRARESRRSAGTTPQRAGVVTVLATAGRRSKGGNKMIFQERLMSHLALGVRRSAGSSHRHHSALTSKDKDPSASPARKTSLFFCGVAKVSFSACAPHGDRPCLRFARHRPGAETEQRPGGDRPRCERRRDELVFGARRRQAEFGGEFAEEGLATVLLDQFECARGFDDAARGNGALGAARPASRRVGRAALRHPGIRIRLKPFLAFRRRIPIFPAEPIDARSPPRHHGQIARDAIPPPFSRQLCGRPFFELQCDGGVELPGVRAGLGVGGAAFVDRLHSSKLEMPKAA